MSNPVYISRAGDRKARDAAAAAKLDKYGSEFWERQRYSEELRQADRAAVAAAYAKQEEERQNTACPCPACSNGTKTLSVSEAAFVYAALAHFRASGLAPTDVQVGTMQRYRADPSLVVVNGTLAPAEAFDNTPATVAKIIAAQAPVMVADDDAGSDEEAIEALTKPKPARKR